MRIEGLKKKITKEQSKARTEEQKIEDVIRQLDDNCPMCHQVSRSYFQSYCDKHLQEINTWFRQDGKVNFVHEEMARRGLKKS